MLSASPSLRPSRSKLRWHRERTKSGFRTRCATSRRTRRGLWTTTCASYPSSSTSTFPSARFGQYRWLISTRKNADWWSSSACGRRCRSTRSPARICQRSQSSRWGARTIRPTRGSSSFSRASIERGVTLRPALRDSSTLHEEIVGDSVFLYYLLNICGCQCEWNGQNGIGGRAR